MRLIVGLGNPGPEYQWTPHNLGFLAVDELANRGGIRVEEVILAKPQTYMNLSGISVRELLEKYELGPQDLLAMWDEAQLPWGAIRIHGEGSAGSHNGAGSLISSLGTPSIARLRLGCGPDHPLTSRKEYVLRPMKKPELELAAEMIADAGDAVEMLLTKGIEAAMAAGFPQIKLNTVLMRGRNDDQLLPLVEFAGSRDLILRFIELMPVSTGDVLHAENFLPVGEARGSLEGRYGALIPEPTFRTNGPSTYYKIPGRDQRVGRKRSPVHAYRTASTTMDEQ